MQVPSVRLTCSSSPTLLPTSGMSLRHPVSAVTSVSGIQHVTISLASASSRVTPWSWCHGAIVAAPAVGWYNAGHRTTNDADDELRVRACVRETVNTPAHPRAIKQRTSMTAAGRRKRANPRVPWWCGCGVRGVGPESGRCGGVTCWPPRAGRNGRQCCIGDSVISGPTRLSAHFSSRGENWKLKNPRARAPAPARVCA